jgi:hypothetical protein
VQKPLGQYTPAFYPQELPNLPIAIPAVLLGQTDQGEAQFILVLLLYLIAQGAARYPKNLTGPSL